MKITQKIISTYLLRWLKMRWRGEFWFNVNLVVNLKNILLLVCEEWHKESRQRTRRMRTSFAHKLTQLHGRYSPCPAHTRFCLLVCVSRVVKREISCTYNTHTLIFATCLAACAAILETYDRERMFSISNNPNCWRHLSSLCVFCIKILDGAELCYSLQLRELKYNYYIFYYNSKENNNNMGNYLFISLVSTQTCWTNRRNYISLQFLLYSLTKIFFLL